MPNNCQHNHFPEEVNQLGEHNPSSLAYQDERHRFRGEGHRQQLHDVRMTDLTAEKNRKKKVDRGEFIHTTSVFCNFLKSNFRAQQV